MIKTTSLTVVTEQNVHGASFTLKTPKLFTATSRQLEMYLPYICYSSVHFLKDECKELLDSLFQQCNAPVNSNCAHPPPGQLRGICTHCQSRGSGIGLPNGYPRAFGFWKWAEQEDECFRQTLHTERSGNGRKFTFYSYFLQRNPINDSVDQAVVVLSAVGFHAQVTAQNLGT